MTLREVRFLHGGVVAQMVERPLCMRKAGGSIPSSSTSFFFPPSKQKSLRAAKQEQSIHSLFPLREAKVNYEGLVGRYARLPLRDVTRHSFLSCFSFCFGRVLQAVGSPKLVGPVLVSTKTTKSLLVVRGTRGATPRLS